MSEDLIPPELIDAPVLPELYELAVDAIKYPHGLHMEFGVYHGRSLRLLRHLLPESVKLYGFDSFEGLPEEWNGLKPGTFATTVRPYLPNTELVVGRFEDTLENFVFNHPGPASLMHIDCDLHSSTRTILYAFQTKLCSGTVIIFDELFGYAGYEQYEYKALKESGLRYDVLGRWNAYRAVIKVK